MLAVRQWAKNRPPLVATLAIQLVSFSDDLYEALPQAKDRRLFARQFLTEPFTCLPLREVSTRKNDLVPECA